MNFLLAYLTVSIVNSKHIALNSSANIECWLDVEIDDQNL